MEAKRRMEYRWKMVGCMSLLFILLLLELVRPDRICAENRQEDSRVYSEYMTDEGMYGIFSEGMIYLKAVD